MLRLPVEVKNFPLQFFVKTRLLEFSRTLIVFIFESYENGLIFTLLFCCFTICWDMQSFHLEVNHLWQIFRCNNYPATLIYQYIKTFLTKIFVPICRVLVTVPKKGILLVLPFLGQFSLNLRSRSSNSYFSF